MNKYKPTIDIWFMHFNKEQMFCQMHQSVAMLLWKLFMRYTHAMITVRISHLMRYTH